VINIKPPKKLAEEVENYNEKFKLWNAVDDDNYAARIVMINTMSTAQLLKYSHEKDTNKLWSLIKNAQQIKERRKRTSRDVRRARKNREVTLHATIAK